MNYSIQEYVNDAVSSIVDACEKNELPQPNIITESGRSLTAHHSVLVFEALASTSLPAFDENEDLAEDAHELVKELYDLWKISISPVCWKLGTMLCNAVKML